MRVESFQNKRCPTYICFERTIVLVIFRLSCVYATDTRRTESADEMIVKNIIMTKITTKLGQHRILSYFERFWLNWKLCMCGVCVCVCVLHWLDLYMCQNRSKNKIIDRNELINVILSERNTQSKRYAHKMYACIGVLVELYHA